jgi:hypothetical protein
MDALARSVPDAERLVIDNASTDGSRTTAERHGATVVGLDENIGFGRACNLGARRAEQSHILFLNPDVAISSVDLDGLAALLDAAEFGLVVPAPTDSSFVFTERSWAQDALSLTFGALRPRELPRPSPSGRGGQALWASGAALLVRRSEFLRMQGFDPRFFLYYEDRDLSWRYRKSGLPVRTTAALAANHVGGGSSDLDDRRSNILAFAILGWLQYVHNVHGPSAAARAWRLAGGLQTAIARSVGVAARIAPSARLRRKDLQLEEVNRELRAICSRSGVLGHSDGRAYWPDAVALLDRAR